MRRRDRKQDSELVQFQHLTINWVIWKYEWSRNKLLDPDEADEKSFGFWIRESVIVNCENGIKEQKNINVWKWLM